MVNDEITIPQKTIRNSTFLIGLLHDLHFFSAIFIIMISEQIIRRVIHQYLEEKNSKKFKKPRKYSKSYCNSTPCDEMGFTQKASCRPYKNCYK
jgi:hypothetical protein